VPELPPFRNTKSEQFEKSDRAFNEFKKFYLFSVSPAENIWLSHADLVVKYELKQMPICVVDAQLR